MAKTSMGSGAPTMIIPNGTQIRVDAHGQLSIRTPGNLVIQNSGSYANLESVSGSIRIEPNVQVEAVNVRCSDTCYVQGSLTAWQVVAKSLHLDGEAEAHILMQQTESMEVGRQARLVGNFQSEKELFLLFSRFARQVRSLPFSFSDETADEETDGSDGTGGQRLAPQAQTGPGGFAVRDGAAEEVIDVEAEEVEEVEVTGERTPPPISEELPEKLFFALVLLEREGELSSHGPAVRRILTELSNLLREGDLETLKHTYRTLFGRFKDPSENLEKANRLVTEFFEKGTAS
ncbi:MAG: hypothetical protein K8J08_10180 [Thermoanaerobaculia bacterium]|nr:hypothetical protein [Thermoanaerobaculia bacterium]